jgi:hypothetical protein
LKAREKTLAFGYTKTRLGFKSRDFPEAKIKVFSVVKKLERF